MTKIFSELSRNFTKKPLERPFKQEWLSHTSGFCETKYHVHTQYKALQTFGDMLRWNPHFHCIVLDGGFDENMGFIYIPFFDLNKMTEYFLRKVITLFLKKNLINENFARNLLSGETPAILYNEPICQTPSLNFKVESC